MSCASGDLVWMAAIVGEMKPLVPGTDAQDDARMMTNI